jgi:hypothetical protein
MPPPSNNSTDSTPNGKGKGKGARLQALGEAARAVWKGDCVAVDTAE